MCRIEKEIEALENEELNISANEEVVLKRLKEVEKTAADIIKVGSVKQLPASVTCETHWLILLKRATFHSEAVKHDDIS